MIIQMIFRLPFFLLLVRQLSGTVYPFPDLNLTIEVVSQGSIPGSSPCTKLIARTDQVYHISQQKEFQSWMKGALTSAYYQSTVSGITLFDWDVSQE